jgi:hypothetical protein
MHDQRVEIGPPLGAIDRRHRLGAVGAGGKAINRLGGQRHQLPAAQPRAAAPRHPHPRVSPEEIVCHRIVASARPQSQAKGRNMADQAHALAPSPARIAAALERMAPPAQPPVDWLAHPAYV